LRKRGGQTPGKGHEECLVYGGGVRQQRLSPTEHVGIQANAERGEKGAGESGVRSGESCVSHTNIEGKMLDQGTVRKPANRTRPKSKNLKTASKALKAKTPKRKGWENKGSQERGGGVSDEGENKKNDCTAPENVGGEEDNARGVTSVHKWGGTEIRATQCCGINQGGKHRTHKARGGHKKSGVRSG